MLLDWYVPAPDVLQLARHVLEGRIAAAEGDLERAIREFAVAVQIQDSLPYLEPAYWYYPVRQSLGAAQLMAGQAEAAAKTFQTRADRRPQQRLGAVGPDAGAAGAGRPRPPPRSRRQRFEQAWAGDSAALELGSVVALLDAPAAGLARPPALVA